MELFITLLIAHLIADWIFQNDWIARNKTNLQHPALYVHGTIHALIMILMTGEALPAFIITVIHMVIDTRVPLQAWMRLYRHTRTGDYAIHVQIWLDQVFHIVSIYFVVQLFL